MTITTITIATVDYISYASLVEADARLAVDPVRATAWALLTDDQKGSNLVAATNRLDLLDWGGQKTGGSVQENAWPRTGLTFKDGTDVSTSEVPHDVEDATIVLAGSITLTASESDAGTSGTNTKRVKAGSAEVSFFRPQEGVALQDEYAYQLVECFLAGPQQTDSAVGANATGTDGCSSYDAERFGLNKPYP